MSTREYYEGVVDDVLEGLGATGAQAAAVKEKLAEKFDDLAAELDEYVCAEARRRIAPVLHELEQAAGEGSPRVSAYVSLQVWRNDYAEEIGEARFDCAPALDKMPLDYVAALEAGDADYETDDVFYEAADLGLVDGHDGPFSCYIESEEELAAYIKARRVREAAQG